MGGKLVAYFSTGGVTRGVAGKLAEAVNAELYEIRPKIPYTRADLDWRDEDSRSSVEMRDPSSRPTIADHEANVGGCDVIFIGFPIWWYVAPTIIHTFLESYDFSGKTIIPFATSGGSGIGETVTRLQESVGSSALLGEGKILNGAQTKDGLAAWARSLGAG